MYWNVQGSSFVSSRTFPASLTWITVDNAAGVIWAGASPTIVVDVDMITVPAAGVGIHPQLWLEKYRFRDRKSFG